MLSRLLFILPPLVVSVTVIMIFTPGYNLLTRLILSVICVIVFTVLAIPLYNRRLKREKQYREQIEKNGQN